MQIKDRIANQPKAAPFTVSADQLVSEAVAKMSEMNYGSAIVTDEDQKVTGILTERDIMKRLVNAGLDAKNTSVETIMTRDPNVAQETDEIEDWMKTISEGRYRRVPVVDKDDRIKAVLTQTDLIAYSWPVILAQTKDIAQRDALKSFYVLMIGGGLLVYAIAMVILIKYFL
ncbi:MAG: CBS domain-containing protein [Pseudomonadota bacterium]